MKENSIENILGKHPQYQNLLFRRGYLFTKKKLDINNKFPFYQNWFEYKLKDYYLYLHKDQKAYFFETKNKTYTLIGHAYNPWDNIIDETRILKTFANAYENNISNFYKELEKVSGVFVILIIEDNNVFSVQDSTGIMPLFYSKKDNNIFYSSHSQLIADICNYYIDPEIERLVNSSFYLIGIRHLPGIKSPFREIKCLTANTFLESNGLKVGRFFPNNYSNNQKLTDNEKIQKICFVLKNSMNIISQKFNASISLTGGTDSKMTLAAAKDYYHRYNFFSFFSTEAEKKDAIAANKICEELGLKHTIYKVPENNNEIVDFEIISQIINHNAGYMKKHKDAELRKIIYLYQQKEIQMEVKSHISEIGRAFYYKKLGMKKMPKKLKPRHMSNLYKRNIFNRKILKYMDDAFREFQRVTNFGRNFDDKYDESDMFYWEHRMSQWASLVKQDFDISHDTTIIFNNRKLLDLFLDFNLNDRINDLPQWKIIKMLNKDLYNINISNHNAMSNNCRIMLEKVFFKVNSILP